MPIISRTPSLSASSYAFHFQNLSQIHSLLSITILIQANSSHHYHHTFVHHNSLQVVSLLHSCHRMARLLILKTQIKSWHCHFNKDKTHKTHMTSMMWSVSHFCTSVLFSLFQTQSQRVENLHWVFPAFTYANSSSLEWSSSHSFP